MTKVEAVAPAKVNLTLHITGQRDDGYHLLDSLVVFTDVGDRITATPAPDLRLSVTGPFALGVPNDETNLVLRAAEVLRKARGVTSGAAITLEKSLPNAAGIGGGSSDAATALTLLARLWNVPPLPASAPEVLTLGADVPACLHAPSPVRMAGIGETLTTLPDLPDCAMVLVNPRVDAATGKVFAALTTKTHPPMADVPKGLGFDDFCAWLGQQRNDLQAPAQKIAPQIEEVLTKLRRMPAIAFAGMSGSGATCFGLTRSMADARQVARVLQVGQMGWWVAPAQVMRATT